MIKKAILLLITLKSSLAFSEYRVYQYYVRSKVKNLIETKAYLVTSTLNPLSYIAYNGGSDSIEVNLLRSWQCMGHTAKVPVCSISEGKELQENQNQSNQQTKPVATP